MRSLRGMLAVATVCAGTWSAAAAAQQGAPSPPPAATPARAAPRTPAPGNEALARELVAMLDVDQRLRRQDDGSQEAAQRMVDTDSVHVRRLKVIVAEHGWPGIGQVGTDAAFAAFIIVQHADGPAQERYLPLFREASTRGDVPAKWLAMLEDRVLWRRGEKQIYGTQVVFTDGHMALWAVEDEAHVDARRARVGLEPLAEYLKGFGITYVPPAP
ncbi:MAG TPA: DUF6624 domain-containing protein [Longimicrobiaceae bacterium]|nr:DUF6624 domain-containing protein [Longimicrobiaceae bacterium]